MATIDRRELTCTLVAAQACLQHSNVLTLKWLFTSQKTTAKATTKKYAGNLFQATHLKKKKEQEEGENMKRKHCLLFDNLTKV